MKKLLLAALALFIAGVPALSAQEKFNNTPLKNSHSLSISAGIKGNSRTSISGDIVSVNTNSGFTGGLEYGYWFNNEWLVGINFCLVEATANINFGSIKDNAVFSILFGFKYYPEALSLGEVGRCYVGFFAGPVTGVANKESGLPFKSESIVETVIGGQILAGVDLFVARWFKMGPALNYNFMQDFSEITGTKKNFSGLGFVFNFGFVL
jgi:hypothetical protein